MNNNKYTKELSISDLYNKNDQYVIPIYQRNYSWGEPEILQLLQDILDVTIQNKEKKSNDSYYIGSLVVHQRAKEKTLFEIIDGQQRHTTLSIILSVLKNLKNKHQIELPKKLNLGFDSRPKSEKTLEKLFEGKQHGNLEPTICSAYEIIETFLIKQKEDILKSLINYLLKKVKIIRVIVPEDTDLNHYFEIMNNRGEQLEKHEVLKARLMGNLDDKYQSIFAEVWDACSDMNGYVLKTNLSVSELQDKFDDISSLEKANTDSGAQKGSTIKDIINIPFSEDLNPENNDSEEKDNNEYSSIINFPNFLLHVLRIYTKKKDIDLDDKYLIKQFDEIDEIEPKKFIVTLLRCRLLFDHYIIKRKEVGEAWSLKTKLKKDKTYSYNNSFNDNDNNKIIMLLSMFHVSFPTQTHKNWLSEALSFLYEKVVDNEEEKISAKDYMEELEKLARSSFQERFNNAEDNLHQGTQVKNYIFNYLDYLLWERLERKGDTELLESFKGKGQKTYIKEKWKKFKFTFRSSVEHYYPQNPINKRDKLDEEDLNHFGNLCLISSSQNSKLSNYMPDAKKEHYTESTTIESLKQTLMMSYDEWKEEQIKDHGEKMLRILGIPTTKETIGLTTVIKSSH